ncbi:hypothetical protein PHLCEN_2v1941 [Hermanssonia centrifuga]|uniref:Zinc finger C3HC4 RING-type domain-containing protein n=1 Tax=Hermanssonia centrifuga TaxID=98765 RepID=A0A2R6RVI3_9APHY|nr:hypothetical protein PHLCEN_2v1941 [Hermanssonia centrifuga]
MDVGHNLDHGVGDTNTKPDLATKDPTKRDRDTPDDVDLEYTEQDQLSPKRRRLTSPDSKTPRDTNEGTSLGISGSTPSSEQIPRLLQSEVEIAQPQAALELESTEHLTEVNAFRGETAGIPQTISPRSPQTCSANLPISAAVASSSRLDTRPPVPQDHEPLSAYICPICFSPPKYATLTPCGHVCCGECLFAAVKTTIQRAMDHGPVAQRAK